MQSSPIAAVLDELHDRLPNPDTDPFPLTEGDRQTLAHVLAAVPDPRSRRGVRYRFTPLLSAAVCAMLCGARSFAAIVESIADLPQPARTSLALTGPTPAGTTVWRLLVTVDPTALQAAPGAWVRARLRHPTGGDPHVDAAGGGCWRSTAGRCGPPARRRVLAWAAAPWLSHRLAGPEQLP